MMYSIDEVQEKLVTENWRANLNRIEEDEYFFIRIHNRKNITTDASSYFKECTSKRFTVTKENVPEGYLIVKRLKDEAPAAA